MLQTNSLGSNDSGETQVSVHTRHKPLSFHASCLMRKDNSSEEEGVDIGIMVSAMSNDFIVSSPSLPATTLEDKFLSVWVYKTSVPPCSSRHKFYPPGPRHEFWLLLGTPPIQYLGISVCILCS